MSINCNKESKVKNEDEGMFSYNVQALLKHEQIKC